jgi:hypothetical protein
MKPKYGFGILSTAFLMAFSVQIVSAQQLQNPRINHNAIKNPELLNINLKPGQLGVRIFFGSSIGGRVPDKCSNVTVRVTNSKNKVIIEQPAEGKDFGYYCLAALKNVPVNKPITLTAQYSDIVSTPSHTSQSPASAWNNPLTLAPGQYEIKHLLIDGKP